MTAKATLAAVVAALVAGGAGGYAIHAGTTDAASPTAGPTASAPAPTTASLAATPTAVATPSSFADECNDASMSQVDLNMCAGRQADAAEGLLTRVVAAVRAKVAADERAVLDRTQREWKAYADDYCRSLAAGGTIDGLVVGFCHAAEAFHRARDVCDWAEGRQPAICAEVPER